jgi:hypothetical protein
VVGRSAVEKLGMADIRRTRLDIVGDLVIILCQQTEQILHLALAGYVRQLPCMIGLAPEVSCAVHTVKTAPPKNHSHTLGGSLNRPRLPLPEL